MAESPIRIAVEVEGIEPSQRFQAACDELAAAAAELIAETEGPEVTGHFVAAGSYPAPRNEAGARNSGVLADDDYLKPVRGVLTTVRPGVQGFNLGMPKG